MRDQGTKRDIIAGTIAVSIFVILGVGLLFWAVILLRERMTFLQTAQHGTGRVIRMERVEVRQTGVLHLRKHLYPVVQLDADNNGKNVIITRSWIGGPKIGDRVKLVYSGTDKEVVYIDSFLGLWIDVTLVFLVAVSAVVVPSYTIWRHFKGKQTNL